IICSVELHNCCRSFRLRFAEQPLPIVRERTLLMAEKSHRGFAAMEPAKQRAIASKGGKAAHAKGTAHEFTAEEARAAGRKGGQAAHARGTAHEFTSDEARAAGRKGGQSTHSSQGNTNPNNANQ